MESAGAHDSPAPPPPPDCRVTPLSLSTNGSPGLRASCSRCRGTAGPRLLPRLPQGSREGSARHTGRGRASRSLRRTEARAGQGAVTGWGRPSVPQGAPLLWASLAPTAAEELQVVRPLWTSGVVSVPGTRASARLPLSFLRLHFRARGSGGRACCVGGWGCGRVPGQREVPHLGPAEAGPLEVGAGAGLAGCGELSVWPGCGQVLVGDGTALGGRPWWRGAGRPLFLGSPPPPAVQPRAHGLPAPAPGRHMAHVPGPVAQPRPTGWKAQPAAWVQGQVG